MFNVFAASLRPTKGWLSPFHYAQFSVDADTKGGQIPCALTHHSLYLSKQTSIL